MNDSVLDALKSVVDRAVRPVKATFARKRRIREELLSHLVSVFEEEAETLGDERTALERAKERFGDPGELSGQLRVSVPRWDRCRSFLESLGYRRGEPVGRLAARHLLVTLAMYAVAVAIWLPIKAAVTPAISSVPGRHSDLAMILPIVLVVALISATLSLLLSPLPSRIGPLLYGRRLGGPSFAVLSVLVSLLIFPLAPAASAIFLLMARQATEERRYREEWA
jgi:hypothetical protein